MEYSKNQQLYGILSQYPINKAILYNAPPANQHIDTMLPRRYMQPSKNDIVYYNLMSLQPNIDMGVHTRYTDDELREWIYTSREYIEDLATGYKELCDVEETHLNNIINQRKNCEALNLDKITRLPADLIRHIKGFLLPETQIQLYISSYPNMDDMLSKLTVVRLKKFYKEHIIPKYYNDFLTTPWKRWIFTNSLKPNNVRISPTTKPEYVKEITNVLHLLHHVIPHTAEIYRHCQLQGLKLIKSILYVSKRFSPVAKGKITSKRQCAIRPLCVTENIQIDEDI